MKAAIERLGFSLSGNMNASQSDLTLDLATEGVTFVMDKVKYLSKAMVGFHADIDAQLDSMIFVLKDNTFSLNDIVLNWSGKVTMPEEDITTDLVFSTPNTSFKSLLSLVPSYIWKVLSRSKPQVHSHLTASSGVFIALLTAFFRMLMLNWQLMTVLSATLNCLRK